MRSHPVNLVVNSDTDLTKLSTKRVKITRQGDQFQISSPIKLFRSECHSFVYRYLRRMKPGMVAISGNCSTPTGYFWSRPASWDAV